MSSLLTLATVAGDDGKQTCYVSFEDAVAKFGAVQGKPTVTFVGSPSDVSISGATMNVSEATVISDNLGTKVLAAGELLTFVVTVTSSQRRDLTVNIEYELGSPAVVHDHERFLILQRPYRVG